MTAELIDGKAIAAEVRAQVAQDVAAFTDRHGRAPGLATILVGGDAASAAASLRFHSSQVSVRVIGSKRMSGRHSASRSATRRVTSPCDEPGSRKVRPSLAAWRRG